MSPDSLFLGNMSCVDYSATCNPASGNRGAMRSLNSQQGNQNAFAHSDRSLRPESSKFGRVPTLGPTSIAKMSQHIVRCLVRRALARSGSANVDTGNAKAVIEIIGASPAQPVGPSYFSSSAGNAHPTSPGS